MCPHSNICMKTEGASCRHANLVGTSKQNSVTAYSINCFGYEGNGYKILSLKRHRRHWKLLALTLHSEWWVARTDGDKSHSGPTSDQDGREVVSHPHLPSRCTSNPSWECTYQRMTSWPDFTRFRNVLRVKCLGVLRIVFCGIPGPSVINKCRWQYPWRHSSKRLLPYPLPPPGNGQI